jgi:carbonic anhydrase/acetyltransferase-like protein (isoleucine patch superfamily)
MAVYRFDSKEPKIGRDCYIADSAEVIGDVVIGDGCYVGPNAVIRGDYGSIVIGNETAVEEGVIIHARPKERTTIGNRVTLGHGAIIHNCRIDDNAVIGMGAVVSDYAEVREWGVVAEGAVVKNKTVVESNCIFAGVPAKQVGQIGEDYKNLWSKFKGIYVELSRTYRDRLKKIS